MAEPEVLQAEPAPGPVVALAAALTARQAASRESITGRTVAVIAALYGRFGSWYDEAALLALAWQASQVSRSGQVAAAGLSAASMRQALALLDVNVPAVTVPVPEEGLRGVDFYTEWTRPAQTYRYERSVGTPDELALQRAVERAGRLAEDDVSLASRVGSRATIERADVRVTGYRRVIHPELSRGGACGLCIVASDRRYSKADLLPIHGRCFCETLPIVDGLDPVTPISQERLEQLYAAAGSTYGKDLKRVRVQFDENSELGPVLAPAGAKTRDKGQASGSSRHPGESDVEQAERLLAFSRQQVDYLSGLVRGGQSKYQPTLDLQRKLVAQREQIAARLTSA